MFIVFKMQQYYAKAVMLHNIKSSETRFENLTISYHDYVKSLVEKNEIFYHGKMYDIKTISFKKDSVSMSVIHDKAEGKVFKRLKELFSPEKNHHKKVPDTILRLITMNYIGIDGCKFKVVLNAIPLTRIYAPNKLTTGIIDVISPPPELV